MTCLRRFALLSLLLLPYATLLHGQSKVDTLNLTFTAIDVPGAAETWVSGVNSAGEMVGWYVPTGSSTGSGFLLSGSNFTFLNYPGGYDTEATKINDAGSVVGNAYISSEGVAGFTYQGGAFKTIQIPGYPDTYAEGIDNAGDIVGGYGFGSANGFEQAGTKFRNVTPPGGKGTVVAASINNVEQIVGWSYDNDGFLYQRGKYRTISVPNSNLSTEALGINDSGIVVGWYLGCAPTCTEHGFASMKGKYFSFDYPGAMFTFALGINNAGQIVGSYSLDGIAIHGYVTNAVNASDLQPPLR